MEYPPWIASFEESSSKTKTISYERLELVNDFVLRRWEPLIKQTPQVEHQKRKSAQVSGRVNGGLSICCGDGAW